MKAVDPVVVRELRTIEKIVRDETWLEGERRGCWVSQEDPVVREKVCEIVLRIGAQLRASLSLGESSESFGRSDSSAGSQAA
jgi:hypothetical protein